MDGRRPPRRPPWWPADEPWPPEGRGGWGPGRSGPPWGHRRGFFRPFGCLILAFALFATGTLTLGVWAIAAIVGIVRAPTVVVVGGIVGLAIVAGGLWLAGRQVRGMTAPIDDLITAAGRIEHGDSGVRVPERGTRGVRSLARAFNAMSARLDASDSRRRTFLADVAHELRTPLTVIQGQLEAIQDGVYPADADHLRPLVEQARALDQLVDDLRTVALAEAGSLELGREPTDVGTLIDDVLSAFRPGAEAAGVRLESDVTSDLPRVALDPGRIRQVLTNLLGNALRHTPAGGSIDVAARIEGADLLVEVRDNGTGIPPELLPTIFERFVKAPGSPGSGLGLAIARDLVAAHGGTIAAESEPDRGTVIGFRLPLGEA